MGQGYKRAVNKGTPASSQSLSLSQAQPIPRLLKKVTTQQVANRRVKRHPPLVIINEIWIKIGTRFHFSLFRLATIKVFSLFPGWLEPGKRTACTYSEWEEGVWGALSVTSVQFNDVTRDFRCTWHLTQQFQVEERVLGRFSWPCCSRHVWGARGSSIVTGKNAQQDHKWPSAGVWLHNFWFIH